MYREETRDADEQLAPWLEAYEAALAAGLPPGVAWGAAAPAALRDELEGLQACLRYLRESWPQSTSTPNDPADGNTASFGPGPSAEPSDPAFAHVPAQLGRYQVVRLLGGGGFGLVYLAWDPLLRREVAVKVPRPEVLLTPGARERVLREARTAAGLDHPHLVPVYEAGEAGPAVYLVSAYVSGPTLEAWLKQRRAPVPAADAARLVRALAGAVAYLHGKGVIHRDLKPGNILLQRTEVRGQRSEVRGQKSEGSAAGADRVPAPSSDLCPLTSVLCPLTSVQGSRTSAWPATCRNRPG